MRRMIQPYVSLSRNCVGIDRDDACSRILCHRPSRSCIASCVLASPCLPSVLLWPSISKLLTVYATPPEG